MVKPEFPNCWSRLLLKRSFDEQFYIPEPPTRVESILLNALEHRFFSDKIASIPIVKPIFLIGVPRSGTSLLYDLLTAHQDAVFINHMMVKFFETPIAAEWIRKKIKLDVSGLRFLNDSVTLSLAGAAEPFTHWGKWFGRDIESLYWKSITRSELGEEKVKQVQDDIRKTIYTYGKKSPRFVCKFATVQPDVLLLQEIFPDAKFINIIRDGRDVAQSLIKLNELSNGQLNRINHPLLKRIVPYPRIQRLAEYVRKYGDTSIECTARVWRDTIALLEEIRPKLKNYHELKYEDLIRDPQPVLDSLFEFCELPAPHSKEFASVREIIGKTQHFNRYEQSDAVEKICSPTLVRYGYELAKET